MPILPATQEAEARRCVSLRTVQTKVVTHFLKSKHKQKGWGHVSSGSLARQLVEHLPSTLKALTSIYSIKKPKQ
jgi:hypothetical protein